MSNLMNNLSQILTDSAKQTENQITVKAGEWIDSGRNEFNKILATYNHQFVKASATGSFTNSQAKTFRNPNRPENAVAARRETTAATTEAAKPKTQDDIARTRAAASRDVGETKNQSDKSDVTEPQESQSGSEEVVAGSNSSGSMTSETGNVSDGATVDPDAAAAAVTEMIQAVIEENAPVNDETAANEDDQSTVATPGDGLQMDPTQAALLMSLLGGVFPGATEPKAVSETPAAEATVVDPTAAVATTTVEAMMLLSPAGTGRQSNGTVQSVEGKMSVSDSQSNLASILEELGGVPARADQNVTMSGNQDGKPVASFTAKSGNLSDLTGATAEDLTATSLNADQSSSKIQLDVISKGHTPSGLVRPFIENGAESKPLNLTVIQSQLAVGETDKTASSIQLMSTPPQQQSVDFGKAGEIPGKGNPVVNKNEVMAQIIDHAKLMVANGHSEMEVNLKPDHLGKLQLKIAVENQTVTAKFTAESLQVKQILESNMDDLRQHLRETGIQVDSLMVSVGNSGANNGEQFNRGFFNQGFGHDGSGAFTYNQPEEQDEPESSRVEARRPVRDTVIDLIA